MKFNKYLDHFFQQVSALIAGHVDFYVNGGKIQPNCSNTKYIYDILASFQPNRRFKKDTSEEKAYIALRNNITNILTHSMFYYFLKLI